MSLKNIIKPTNNNNNYPDYNGEQQQQQLDSIQFHFESVLDSPELKLLFIEFLKMNQTYESLQFVERVQEYMALHSEKNRFKKAQEIVLQFIRVGSESELNTVMSLRNEVEDEFIKCSDKSCPIDLFKRLYTVMLVSLKEDPFMRFTKWAKFRSKLIELVVRDQSFLLDLCFNNPENERIGELISQYSNENSEERQKLMIDVRRRYPIGVPLNPVKVKSGKIFKQSKTYMCFTGYDLVNWICGYFRIQRDSSLEIIHKVLQLDTWIVPVDTKGSSGKSITLVEDSHEKYYRFLKKKRLVVVGGGYAGSYLCKAMQEEFDVTLIDKKPRFESVFSFNRLVHDPSHYDKISSEHGNYLTKGRICLGKVEQITPYYVQLPHDEQVERIYFDYLVVATGSSYIEFPIEVNEKAPVIINPYDSSSLIQNNPSLKQAKNIVCVGGGPVSVEMAGEIAHYYPQAHVTMLTSAERLMERTSLTVHDNVLKLLTAYDNVTIRTLVKVHRIRDSTIIYSNVSDTSDQSEMILPFDVALVCVGFVPNTQMFQSQMSTSLDSNNRVKVNSYFNVKYGDKADEVYDNIFALGDITDVDEEKLAQSAHKNASKLAKVLPIFEGHDAGKKVKSMEYVPKKRIMIVSVGPKKGILIRDSQVILENALLLKAKSVAEYQTLRGIK